MSGINVYNTAAKEVGTMDLSPTVFAAPVKESVLHQVVTALQANARRPYAHVKDRSEVRGGGRKPWRQKGTGRARHGSSRSPIWRSGGATFGPRNVRNFSQKVNKKVKKAAMRMVLSDKAANKRLVVVDSFKDMTGKTKEAAGVYQRLVGLADVEQKKKGLPKTLVVVSGGYGLTGRATSNIPHVQVRSNNDLSVLDVLKSKVLVMSKEAVEAVSESLS